MPWNLTQFSQSPSAALFYFPDSHQWSEISSFSKVILVLGKAGSHRVPNRGCTGAESPGCFDVSQKNLSTRCDAWAGTLSGRSCLSPVAHSCSLLNHLNSFHGGMSKHNRKIWCRFIALLAQSFWMLCHTVHMLTQWHLPPPLTSTVKLSLFAHVHSSPLSLAARLHRCGTNHACYINNDWTFSGQT